jgi:hypothetical protein
VDRSAELVASGVVGEQTLVLNVRTGTYLTLSGAGPRLWQLRQTHGDAGAVRLASAEYGVREELVRVDLDRMLTLVATLRVRPDRVRWSPPRATSLRRIGRVPPRSWPTLAGTLCLAAAVEVGLRRLSLPRLAALAGMRLVFDAEGFPAQSPVAGGGLTQPQRRRVWATDRVYARWPFGDTCLRRALVLGFHLRRDRPRLRIGASVGLPASSVGAPSDRETAQIAAHAWVETPRATLLALHGFESLTTPAGEQRPS